MMIVLDLAVAHLRGAGGQRQHRATVGRLPCFALGCAGIDFLVYDDVVCNPTIDNVEAARYLYLKEGCDCLIAFGGGSSMDCAKACGARLARPNKPIPKMRGILKVMRRTPLIVAVPTTAGTGSETTLAAVITDGQTHYKYPINDFPLIPSYAVLDWKVTAGLPKHITSTTGIDALVHATEAYIGRSTTKETRACAVEAVDLIRRHLKRACDEPSNQEARQAMLHAANRAGLAFSKSYVGYVHAVAHSLGGQYGIPHGLANAVICPYVLEMYGPACHKRLGELARLSGVAPTQASDEQASHIFIEWFRELNAARYEGPYSIEWEDSGMDRIQGATESCKYVKDLRIKPSDVAFDAALKN